MNKEIGFTSKVSIYVHTFIKLLRGSLNIPFIHKVKFPLFMGRKAVISHKKNIIMGKKNRIEHHAEIQGLAQKKMVFGNNISIGPYTMIRPTSYYGSGELGVGITIGDNSSIGPYSYIGCSGEIVIGKNVMLGPRVSLFAENHVFNNSLMDIKTQGVIQKGIIIEDNCWIGSGVIILDGVRIGTGSIIGAGSLINKDVPSNSVIYNKKVDVVTRRNEQ